MKTIEQLKEELENYGDTYLENMKEEYAALIMEERRYIAQPKGIRNIMKVIDEMLQEAEKTAYANDIEEAAHFIARAIEDRETGEKGESLLYFEYENALCSPKSNILLATGPIGEIEYYTDTTGLTLEELQSTWNFYEKEPPIEPENTRFLFEFSYDFLGLYIDPERLFSLLEETAQNKTDYLAEMLQQEKEECYEAEEKRKAEQEAKE